MFTLLKTARKIFARDERGTAAMMFATLMAPALLFTGSAVDYARALTARQSMQGAADAAVITAASVTTASPEQRIALARQTFEANIEATLGSGLTITTEAVGDRIVLNARYAMQTSFMKIARIDTVDMAVSSTASFTVASAASNSVCMLALNPTTFDGLHLQGTNSVQDRNCWAWVNSKASGSMNATGTADASASGFCTSGSVIGANHFTPLPMQGCSQIPDPFANRAQPVVSGCDQISMRLSKGTYTLYPGVYCGGLELKPGAVANLSPGVYIIRDGTLNVQGQSTINGDGVTIYFTGIDAKFSLQGGANAVLKAPATGAYAGFVLMDDRTMNAPPHSVIQGGGNVVLTGVLYMPKRVIEVGGNGTINASSPYFGMVADSFYLIGNGTLYLKSDWAAAGLPDILPKVLSNARITN